MYADLVAWTGKVHADYEVDANMAVFSSLSGEVS